MILFLLVSDIPQFLLYKTFYMHDSTTKIMKFSNLTEHIYNTKFILQDTANKYLLSFAL